MTRRDDIQKLILMHEHQVQLLKEQQATYGLQCPPYIILSIEQAEAEIANLRAELGQGGDAEHSQSNLPRQPYFFGREDE